MQVNLIASIFILDSEKNNNIRKNDIKKLKVVVDQDNNLPQVELNTTDMKKQMKKFISKIIGSNIFHLEQVYSINNSNCVDIIYLCVTNIENLEKLSSDYSLIDFNIENNNLITYGKNQYNYQTEEIEENNNIEYIHKIDVKKKALKNDLLDLIISYKRIRSNIDGTDLIFKFMSKSFTLEDVRILYEMITDTTVDKSNFRKKIVKYCEKDDSNIITYNGFRPSQRYKFVPLKGDIWI